VRRVPTSSTVAADDDSSSNDNDDLDIDDDSALSTCLRRTCDPVAMPDATLDGVSKHNPRLSREAEVLRAAKQRRRE
jgi:hypothetical protein